MNDTVDALVLDLLEWVAKEDRPYLEAMDAWRTSCPRLPVWEEACDRRLIARVFEPDRGALIRVTREGRAFLAGQGR